MINLKVIHRLAPIALLALQACVYVPKTTAIYDSDCQITTMHMDLEPVQIAALGNCRNEGCTALLVTAGATAAASAVISGSIVVVGNAVYWFEEHGNCLRQN